MLLLLMIVALVSISRSARALTPGQALGWTLLAIFVPAVGPLAWLFIGRRSTRTAVPVSVPEARGIERG